MPHIVADVVEIGVTAVACGIRDAYPPLVVSILAPTARLELTGVGRAASWTEATAREIAERLAGTQSG